MNEKRLKTLAIIGQGYVGLPLAMAAVEAGWNVIGVDNSEEKVKQINAGKSPVEDITNQSLLKAVASLKYCVTSNYSLVSEASVIALCVPTPLDQNRNPDLSFLVSAARAIAPHLVENTLVVSESTSYPGTLRDILVPEIELSLKVNNQEIYFASAPERVNPGDSMWNLKNTPRLIGGLNNDAQIRAMSFYESICENPILVSSPEIAETAKLLENTFRLVNIALINEVAQICNDNGISVSEVVEAASTKPYGFMKFTPGVGVGGHCIPVDPLYLTWWARNNGSAALLVEAADKINIDMPKYVAQRALDLLESAQASPRILILGVAYKPGVGDIRETPVSELRKVLQSQGAIVGWHDPFVTSWEETLPNELTWNCDIAIIATNQPGVRYASLLDSGVRILDCAGTGIKHPNITSL